MENLFTRGEVITFKIIGWVIAVGGIIAPVALFFYNSRELKRSEKRQEKRTDDLLKKLQGEIVARKDSEKSIVEADAKSWKSLYLSGEEKRKKDWEHFEGRVEKYEKLLGEKGEENDKLKEVIMRLRWQLEERDVPREKHDIDDDQRCREVIREVKVEWRLYSKNGKIKGKTITEVLWENWEKVFNSKEGEDIIKERDRIIKLIDDAKLAK